jgi:hypothetical protein
MANTYVHKFKIEVANLLVLFMDARILPFFILIVIFLWHADTAVGG